MNLNNSILLAFLACFGSLVILLFILQLFKVLRKIKYFQITAEPEKSTIDIIQLPEEKTVEEQKENAPISNCPKKILKKPRRFISQPPPLDFNMNLEETKKVEKPEDKIVEELKKEIEGLKNETEGLRNDVWKLRRIIAQTGSKVSVRELKSLTKAQLVANSLYVMNTIYLRCC